METKEEIVLVTGANGYIAGRVVEALLEAGYSVRGTVRSKTSADGLCKAIQVLPHYCGELEIVEIPDILVKGAFDEAVKGVKVVVHIAAPVDLDSPDPDVIMKISLDGLTRALEAASAESSVRSFIFMSSVAAIRSDKEGDYTFTEADWNTDAERILAEQGRNAPPNIIYEASKVAAEKAMWKYRDEHKPKFTMTAINPYLVAGPPLVVPASEDKIPISTKMIWEVFMGKPLDKVGIPGIYHGYVDVRDVARLVLFAADRPDQVDNERFILARYYSPPQAVADIIRRKYPSPKWICQTIQEGTPGEGYDCEQYTFPKKLVYDGSKARCVMGRDYIPWEKTVVDTIERLKPLLL
ncbi:hypothetical protein B0H66DRAFT_395417 [Apodospora peruviana]|uniref:NAD-dependent epimerase/dehydratase domain-containing protein n=1 Tax=Apodospora peruviana TaxID=516989 RepID=A0AAE0HSR2_9PEZI|nr:hypothetical protein B0H66DRAFT_395417 [Apodospora peruviana]